MTLFVQKTISTLYPILHILTQIEADKEKLIKNKKTNTLLPDQF